MNFKVNNLFKDSIKKMKRQTTDLEKIITINISSKELAPGMHNKLPQINNKMANYLIFKMSKGLNRHCIKDDIRMANKHMRKCPT